MSPATQSVATKVTSDTLGAFRRITLDNGSVRAVFLPELGGKMISLVRLASGYDFLLPPPEAAGGRGYRRAAPGAAFEEYDTSGFDECVPTVAACRYDAPGLGPRELPDHGDLWSEPWQARVEEGTLLLDAEGRSLPYHFRRRARLEQSDVLLDYEVENRSSTALQYLWSAHPLLRPEQGARIVLPAEVGHVGVYWSKKERLGPQGGTRPWPGGRGEDDLSVLGLPARGYADKLFTPRLRTGLCALHLPASDESISFRFDPVATPFVGLWICQGGWPTSRAAKHFTVALEPTTAPADSLCEAVAAGTAESLKPGEVRRWSLRLELRQGAPKSIIVERGAE